VRLTGVAMTGVTNDSGVYTLTGLPLATTVSIEATRVGLAPARIDSVRLNQRIVTQDLIIAAAPMVIRSVTTPVDPTTGVKMQMLVASLTAGSYYGGVNFAALTAALDSAGVPGSFLATEDNFRYMKDLHSRNLFIPIVGDFAGPKAIRSVGNYLRAHGTTLTAFYTSNVEEYLFSNQVWRAFYDNAATLPVTPSSVFIRSGSSTCPIAAFLAAVSAGRVRTSSDATRCVM
jgi:hypothetical protein